MIEPPAVPLAPGWHDDPESPARLRYYDGEAWTDRTSDRAAPAAAISPPGEPLTSAALEMAVNTSLREGFAVQSRLGDTVVISRKAKVSGGLVVLYVLGIVLLFPLGLLLIIPWVLSTRKLDRFTLRQLPDGTIERKMLFNRPVPEAPAQPPREPSNNPVDRFTRWIGARPLRIIAMIVVVVALLWGIAAIAEVIST